MTNIFRLKVSLRGAMCDNFPANYCTRTIEISGSSKLKKLAQTILQSYDFAFDHAFGFYDDLKDHYASKEIYTSFADFDDFGPDDSHGKPVSKTMISRVFTPEKSMLFLFDYGDEWVFHVQCLSVGETEEGQSYPVLVEAKGDAPKQYPDYDEEDVA